MSTCIKSLVEAATATFVDRSVTQASPIVFIKQQLSLDGEISMENRFRLMTAAGEYVSGRYCASEAFDFFSLKCSEAPSMLLVELFTELAKKTLKTNSDFAKNQKARFFIQDFLLTMCRVSEDAKEAVTNFIQNVHGMTSLCPFPRVLPNLLAVCLTAIFAYYEAQQQAFSQHHHHASVKHFSRVSFFSHLASPNTLSNGHNHTEPARAHAVTATRKYHDTMRIFVSLLSEISKYEDWRSSYAAVMNSVPFHHAALSDVEFLQAMQPTVKAFANDRQCSVHSALLNSKEGKDGWLQLYAPGAVGYQDDGVIFAESRRKRFCLSLLRYLSALMLLALRENECGIAVLLAMLEYEIVDSNEMHMHIVTALTATASGARAYEAFAQQKQLGESHLHNNNKKLSLPARSTDEDLRRVLSNSQCSHLELLSLAFTSITSAAAHDISKLHSLRYLNLWRTSVGDDGLEIICDRLHKLQVLNLAETKVTDLGARYLVELKHLRKLNLSNTSVSASTVAFIRERLPSLTEIDLRYTEVW